MTGRSRVLLLFFLLASALPLGCSTERQRQWVKPGADYTTTEFKRDRDGCTKPAGLDEQCMKEKGWVPITADKEVVPAGPAPTPRMQPPSSRGGRY